MRPTKLDLVEGTAREGPGAVLPEAATPRDAARVLGLAEKTLANWRAAAFGPPYVKYGSRNGPVRYVLSELVAWRDAHRRRQG